MVYLDPTSDIVFKKLFGTAEHKNVPISFLNSILERPEGEKITDLIVNDPNNLPETIDAKSSIVDVRCTDQQGNNYIVEMQVMKQKDYAVRCQYYTALALSRQLKNRERFNKLTPVIFVGILDFTMLETDHYISHHFILDNKTSEHVLKHLEFHFIELKKFTKTLEELKNNLDKWIFLFRNAPFLEKIPGSLKKPAALENAFDILEQGQWSKKELEIYDRSIDAERSWENQLETAVEDGLKKVAYNLLTTTKMSLEEIAQATELPIAEIKKLKKKQ